MINWNNMPAFFSIREVAFLYGLSIRQVRNIVDRGGLPSVQLSGTGGKRWLPAEAVLNKYPGTRQSLELRVTRMSRHDVDDVCDDAA